MVQTPDLENASLVQREAQMRSVQCTKPADNRTDAAVCPQVVRAVIAERSVQGQLNNVCTSMPILSDDTLSDESYCVCSAVITSNDS
jgi:hypothetical protein